MAKRKLVVEVEVELQAVDGRVPGRRGRATRDKLLRCTSQLLAKTSYRDLTVIDIARCAGCSPATFYQYFGDVEAAVLVLAQAMGEEGRALADLVRDSDWKSPRTAAKVVDAFLEFWERHRALLRVVDMSTAEGDLRFQNIRTHVLNEVTVSLRDVIAGFKAHGRHPREIEPMAQAAALVSMLAHVASHQYGYEFWGIRMDDMRGSLVRMTTFSVTGRPPA